MVAFIWRNVDCNRIAVMRPWDRPKPNGGKYYCATLHKYIADPNDCPKKSN